MKTSKVSLFIILLTLLPLLSIFAQVSINSGGLDPDPSAILDIQSSSKGFLIPRMTESQRNLITNPAAGLLVYQTDIPAGFYVFDGDEWMFLGTAQGSGGHMFDADGNAYSTVKIGNQEWMAENLKTTHFSDGSAISLVTDNTAWSGLGLNPGYCYVNGDNNNTARYGYLYNWYAANDSKGLCPQGWHIPDDSDFSTLISFLGDPGYAGGKAKAAVSWNPPNSDANNSSGFSGFGSGYRLNSGVYVFFGDIAGWWTVSSYNTNMAWERYLQYGEGTFAPQFRNKNEGFSVRCLRD